MDRSTPRRRAATNAKTTHTPTGRTPRQAVINKRPAITTNLSKAYGAPGKVKMPTKVTSKPAQNMLDVMKDMIDEDESEPEREQDEESGGNSEDDDIDEEEEDIEVNEKSQEEEEDEEIDEVKVVDSDDDMETQIRPRDHGQTSSPFVAIANKIRNMWGSSAGEFEASFITEDKIASEAKIARPREPLARKLLRWKEKCINLFEELGGSSIAKTIILLLKYFMIALAVLLVLQTLSSALPEDISIARSLGDVKETITTPIYSFLDRISSNRQGSPGNTATEIDLSQLKALKDSTTAQFKHLKSRLDNIESTYNRLAKKVKTPTIPERKVNLFSPGSGLTIDPYLTSPTRARDVAKKNLVAKWFGKWRGYPDSVHHGPLSAFTPWEDMGDCWCSPDSGGKAQVVVELGQPIIPKELVVEHVPKDATLQAGSAPKDIELWVQIKDRRLRTAVIKSAIDYGVHQNAAAALEDYSHSLDDTWVNLGRWKYEIRSSSNVQTFDVTVPLEQLDAPVSRLAFRSTSNWGPVEYVCLYRLKLHGLVSRVEVSQDGGMGY